MNKKKILYGVFGTIALASIPLATTLAVTSCNSNAKTGQNVKTVTFDVANKSLFRAQEPSAQLENIYSADLNPNAKNELDAMTSKLSRKQLQTDFNRVLTDFYDTFEAKLPNGTEIEVERINVLSEQKEDGSFDIEAVVEIEQDDSRSARDKEITKTVKFSWTPKFCLMSDADINQIKEMIRGFGTNETNSGMDLEDIKELFLGEVDDDKDFDDIGIFDKIALINKNYDNLAYLIAYELSVSDIFDPIKAELSKQNSGDNTPATYNIKKANGSGQEVNPNTMFKIPSLSLNSGTVALVPSAQPKFEFTNILPRAEFSALFAKTELNPTIAADKAILDTVFTAKDEATKTKFYDSIEKVIVNSSNSSITVKYKDTSLPWETISIAAQWGL